MCVSEAASEDRFRVVAKAHGRVRRHLPRTGLAKARVVAKTRGRAKTHRDDRSSEDSRKREAQCVLKCMAVFLLQQAIMCKSLKNAVHGNAVACEDLSYASTGVPAHDLNPGTPNTGHRPRTRANPTCPHGHSDRDTSISKPVSSRHAASDRGVIPDVAFDLCYLILYYITAY